MQSIDPELIRKFHAGQCSPEEQKLVMQWLTSEENLMKQAAGSTVQDPVMENEIWAKIHPELKGKGTHNVFRMASWRAVAAVACVLIVIAGGYLLQQSVSKPPSPMQVSVQLQTYTTLMGSRTKIMLADSSIVHLMGGSSVRFPNTYTTGTREFYLDSGEVFLQVASRPQQPFIVHSGDAAVQVLGTQFNFRNRPSDPFLKVLLTEGKVQFLGADHSARILVPGEELIYNKALAQIKSVQSIPSPDLKAGWKDGILYFDHDPLTVVLDRLKDYYGVDFSVDPAVDLQRELTASYRKMSLQQVLTTICFSASLNFEINGKKVTIKNSH